MKTRNLSIMLTHKCPLRCPYCFEGAKDGVDMPPDTAIGIIDHELNADNGYDGVQIEAFGGEPFSNMPLFMTIVNHLERGAFAKEWTFGTITNGVLVHGELQRWLLDHRDTVDCSLSYDGTPAMQEANRPGSSEAIDLAFWRTNFPGMRVKMTVSSATLPHLAEGTIWLHEQGFVVSNNIAYGVRWEEGSGQVLKGQLDDLIEYYVANPGLEPCAMLDFPYERIYAPYRDGVIFRSCSAGTDVVCYDVSGLPYACQMWLPLSMGGRAGEAEAFEGFPPDLVPPSLMDDECRECPLASACSFCYGDNFKERGGIFRHDPVQCEINRITFKAKARLAAERWRRGDLSLAPEDERALLESILLVDAMAA